MQSRKRLQLRELNFGDRERDCTRITQNAEDCRVKRKQEPGMRQARKESRKRERKGGGKQREEEREDGREGGKEGERKRVLF